MLPIFYDEFVQTALIVLASPSRQELAGKLGVRGLPMLIFYKNGKRVDHHTTANINTIEEAIRDNT